MSENEEELPEIHTGTIIGVSSQFSGLQSVSFGDHVPVYIENYGVRQLYSAAEHMGQENPVGMRIEFAMDDTMGFTMQSFQIIGNETHVACYGCQKVMEIYRVADEEEHIDNKFYSMCQECGHIYCSDCKDKACPYCELVNQNE